MTSIAGHELDKFFSSLYRRVYPDNQMKAQVEALQDQLEDYHLQILDINESRNRLVTEVEDLREQVDAQRKAREAQAPNVARCTQLEADVRRLTTDYDTLRKNYDHVAQLHNSKEAILKEAMKIVEDLRAKVKKGEEYKGQAEHLARQVIRINDEKVKLGEEVAKLKTDYVTLMENFKGIKEQVPDLIEENNKFREQTVRLVNEKANLECAGMREGRTDSLCGGCLACQLEQAKSTLAQTAKNVDERNKERDNLKATLEATLKSHMENQKLIQAQSTHINHLTHILRILRDAMGQVHDAPFYARKCIAARALKDRLAYVEMHKGEINGDY